MKKRVGLWAGVRALLPVVAWLATAVCAAGCVTPTLPPDDPPEPDVELGVGVARLRGTVGAGPSFVLVHNRVSGLVFGQRSLAGEYDLEVRTEPCDLLALWYTMGSFQSTAVTFRPAEIAGTRNACSGAAEPPEPAPDADAGP